MPNELTTKKNIREKMYRNKGLGGCIICLVIAAVFYFLTNIKIIDGASIATFLSDLVGLPLIGQLIEAAFIMFLMISLAGITKFIVSKIKPKSNRASTLLEVIYSAANYVYIIVGIIMVLVAFDVDVVAIATTVGILGIVVGFGAESLIADVFTGICLIFENQFNVGDIIEVSGFRGEVVQIGIRTTSVRDFGGNIKIMNNSDIRDVLNCSSKSSVAVCDIGVSYDTDIEKAEAVLAQTFAQVKAKYPEIFFDIRYSGVNELADSAVILRVVADTTESNIHAGRRILNRALLLAFKENDIEIPFPQMVVHKN